MCYVNAVVMPYELSAVATPRLMMRALMRLVSSRRHPARLAGLLQLLYLP